MDKSHCGCISEMPKDSHRMGPDRNTKHSQLPLILVPVSTASLVGLGHIEGRADLGLAVGNYGA